MHSRLRIKAGVLKVRIASAGVADAGTVTAEFAAALPAVALVLACAFGAIDLGGEQLRLQGAAFDAARLLGRGDPGAQERIRLVVSDATLGTRSSGKLICADASAPVQLGILSGIVLRASACALYDAQT
jgi:hypothetical protein